jgi:hypothetical protein
LASLLNSTPKLKIFIPNNLSIKQIYKNMSNYGYTLKIYLLDYWFWMKEIRKFEFELVIELEFVFLSRNFVI